MSTAIAIDIDGVLADFTKGFSRLAARLFPGEVEIVADGGAPSWDYKEWFAGGGKRGAEIVEETWDAIFGSKRFWRYLPPLFTRDVDGWKMLRACSRQQPYIFITRREGFDAWGQTIDWLVEQGIEEPLVYRTRSGEEKADVCRALGINVMIEDSPKNIPLLLDAGINVVMMRWPYNEHLIQEYGERLAVASTLYSALDKARFLVYNRTDGVQLGSLPSGR